MNRFRTKKRGKDEVGAIAPRPSQESESSTPFRSFLKGKKSREAEPAPLDLATVLPSNDDFRTSLLMTGLSARFSMLREQDDPNTKIGKASDDSVLFPKRQSRLDMGAFGGLGDIAEVESIKAPFARMGSYASDDADSLKSGSIMNRSKPTEGNNLFGGRQKIYKIPVGAASSKTVDGGMGGRALYDDDVAVSAFQKWRRAERERARLPTGHDDDNRPSSGGELELPRSTSPAPSDYNQKRETSSTFSSIPSMARNSSAATSITSSQNAPSLKDWQQPNNSNPGLERSVTRTRRLYETGFLSNDSQEAGPGGLPRVDTLGRQRPFGARTPDLGQYSPSPTSTSGFGERFGGERKLLAKASAPNLRSMSPPMSATRPDLGIRPPSDGKSNMGGAPPLSPPISETDESGVLPIGPNDRGKATALGVFQKPNEPYDESRFAQRQLQLQRGRETPTQRLRDESNPPTTSRSSKSPPSRKNTTNSVNRPAVQASQESGERELGATSFLADADDSDVESLMSSQPGPSSQVHLRRPSDGEHPALRDPSALPTLLSLSLKINDESSSIAELSPGSNPKGSSPVDSPTLGPTADGSGLSGMVRQHLRGDSNASSIYGAVPPTAGLESRFPSEAVNGEDYDTESNPWSHDHAGEWDTDLIVDESHLNTGFPSSYSHKTVEPQNSADSTQRGDQDDFARELADGARRIRERLTSYVETDSRSSSPQRGIEQSDSPDNSSLPRSSGIGSILRPKRSRGSLAERGRDPSATRSLKLIGFGSPAGSRTGSPGAESVRENMSVEKDRFTIVEQDEPSQRAEEPAPGLKTFRQARRELQRLKELESQSRHQLPEPQGPPPGIPAPQPKRPATNRARSPSGDGQQRVPRDPSQTGLSSPSPRGRGWIDRQQSESGSSGDNRSTSRPARSRDNSAAVETTYLSPSNSAPRPTRSPGLPGTDIKRSPYMPPQGHPNLRLNGNLHAPRHGGYDAGQPSPISPIPSPLVSSAPHTPITSNALQRPAVMQSNSYDSGPGVSRIPGAGGNRSRSNSKIVPPLPPINPRRRKDSTKATSPESDGVGFDRRLLQRTMPEGGGGMNINFNRLPLNQAPVNLGPPASRMVVTQTRIGNYVPDVRENGGGAFVEGSQSVKDGGWWVDASLLAHSDRYGSKGYSDQKHLLLRHKYLSVISGSHLR
ncbi:hypothetical protein F5Y16DRAFT_397420 [Xylariaceae sp. FL0255]|nr:hypothetical protein F5Y16DRAFT_397420 [Xylariaceae sp. FL0255]